MLKHFVNEYSPIFNTTHVIQSLTNCFIKACPTVFFNSMTGWHFLFCCSFSYKTTYSNLILNFTFHPNLVFCSSALFRNLLRRFFSVEGVSNSLHMLPTMVHGQAFCIIAWQSPYPQPGTHWAALWVWNLGSFTKVDDNLCFA